MRLVTFQHAETDRYGIETTEGILDLRSAWPDGPETLLELLHAGPEALDHARALIHTTPHRLDPAAVRLLAPLPRPGKLIALAVNYLAHHNEFERDRSMPDDPTHTTTPRPFLMPSTCVIGPGETIPWPDFSEEIDHEVELAVVIGSTARHVPVDRAREYVAGYTIVNDISARSVTHAAGRADRGPKDGFFDWLHGKWGDGFCPMGPCLLTADEVPDPQDLPIQLRVNGDLRQDASTAAMIFSVDQLIAFCSHLMTLEPGDVIATGTPSGVAKATGLWPKPGDEMSCRIGPIGELTNSLGDRPNQFYRPCQP